MLVVNHNFNVVELENSCVARVLLKELQCVHIAVAATLCHVQKQARGIFLTQLPSNMAFRGIAERNRRGIKSSSLHEIGLLSDELAGFFDRHCEFFNVFS